jgi:putative redox protein
VAENKDVVIQAGRDHYRAEVFAGGKRVVVDEPLEVGGKDAGPSPYDLLLGSIGACTAMTLRMYADRKGWPLESVVVRLRQARTYDKDCVECVSSPVGPHQVERELTLEGDLTEEQKARLVELADRCPIKQTLERGLHVVAAPPSAGAAATPVDAAVS